LNDQLENRDFYDKGKALVQGVVDQVNKATDETEKDLKKTFNGVGNFVSNISSDIKLILGGLFLFFLLQRK
jgi:ABC-type nitrate/sulfonate/bicarbonate transport system substrate-binding protein